MKYHLPWKVPIMNEKSCWKVMSNFSISLMEVTYCNVLLFTWCSKNIGYQNPVDGRTDYMCHFVSPEILMTDCWTVLLWTFPTHVYQLLSFEKLAHVLGWKLHLFNCGMRHFFLTSLPSSKTCFPVIAQFSLRNFCV